MPLSFVIPVISTSFSRVSSCITHHRPLFSKPLHMCCLPLKRRSRYSSSNFPLDIGPSTGIYKLVITIWLDECMQSTGRQSKTRNFAASTLQGRYLRGKRVLGIQTAEFLEVLMKFIRCF